MLEHMFAAESCVLSLIQLWYLIDKYQYKKCYRSCEMVGKEGMDSLRALSPLAK